MGKRFSLFFGIITQILYYGLTFGLLTIPLFIMAQVIHSGGTNITPYQYLGVCLGFGWCIVMMKSFKEEKK